MVSKTIFLVFVCIAANVVILIEGMDLGSFAPLIPTKEEKNMCKDEAASEGLEYEFAMKEYGNTCKVKCLFKDGKSKTLDSPKELLCCDIGGALPTGMCDGEGTCKSFIGIDEKL